MWSTCLFSPQVTGRIIYQLHLRLHRLKGQGRDYECAPWTVLWRRSASSRGGWRLGLEKHKPRSTFSLITHWCFPALWDASISDSCSSSGCVQQHVRRHSSCWPWLWLGGTAVCVNEAIAMQTSEAVVLEHTRAPLGLQKAPGYVNNDLMRMRAITVINTAHVKHCQLSRVSGRSCITLKRLACND